MIMTAPLIKLLNVDGKDEEKMNSNTQFKPSAFQKLHFKDKSGICRDDGWISSAAICVVRRAGQLGHLAQAHLSYTFIPTTDDFTCAQFELEGWSSVPGGVELLAVCQGADIMHWNHRSFLRKSLSVSWSEGFDVYSHCSFSTVLPLSSWYSLIVSSFNEAVEYNVPRGLVG